MTHFHPTVTPPTIKKQNKTKMTFYIFPGICDFTRIALYARAVEGNPVQWDKAVFGITLNEIKTGLTLA